MTRSDPRRLVEYGEDLRGVLRDALRDERAAGADAATQARLAAIEAKLVAKLATPGSPDAAAPQTPPGGAGAAPSAPVSSWVGSKAPWLLVGAAALAGVAFLTLRAGEGAKDGHSVPTSTAALAPAPPAHAAGGRPNEAPPPPPDVPTFTPSDLPAAPPGPTAPAKATAAASAATDGEEIALLARAHDALRGRPAESLELCKQHEARFPSGHFVQEREAVAIEALVYLNRREEAERRWEAFRTRHPTSSHRVHLESLFSARP